MTSSPHPRELDLELLMRHRAWLRALAARLVGPGLADDLLQETWLAAVRHPPDPGRPARPWLASVARRLAGRLRGKEAPLVGDPQGGAPSSGELLEKVELEARLVREVARLEEPFRRTVLLRYHEGFSAVEIARQDGVPAGTVRWRLKRGLDELRGRLDKDYGDRKSWVALLAGLAGVEAGGGWLGLSLTAKLAGAAGIAALLTAGGVAWIARPAALAARDARAPAELAEAQAPAGQAEAGTAGAPVAQERRAAERPELAAVAESKTGLAFEIIEWDGAPAADVLVALRERGGIQPGEPTVARTDGAGRAAFPQVVGALEVAIDRRSAKTFRLELEADGAEHRIELPRGAVVAGRVVVEGQAPVRPVNLELYRSDEPDFRVIFAEEPPVAWLFADNGLDLLHATTDATGAFAFLGLEPDWRGILRLPRGCVPRGTPGPVEQHAQHMIFLPAPTEGLALDLVRSPSVRGRIVTADGGEPVKYAILNGSLTWSDGLGLSFGAPVNVEGLFEFILDRPDWRSLTLEYVGADKLGRVERTFARSEVSADGDLGDLPLARGREVTLRVVDAAGRPIAGALIDKQGRCSDERGELRFTGVPPEGGSVWVAAPGYAGETVSVPAGVDGLEVVLDKANRLTLEVRDSAGQPLPGIEVELSASEPCFVSSRGYGPDQLTPQVGEGYHRSTLFNAGGSVDGGGPRTESFQMGPEGRLVLAALRPGLELAVSVQSPCSVALREERIQAPGPGEQRTVVLAVKAELRSLRVRVVDQDGIPMAGASVGLKLPVNAEIPGGIRCTTDGEGLARADHLTLEDYCLHATKPGYLNLDLDPFRLPDEELEVVLARGLDVAVTVRDTEGRPVPGGVVECDVLGERQSFKESDAGRFEVQGLPDERVELALQLAGVTYTLQHDPRIPRAEFVVPVHGSVVVKWAAPPDADWSGWLLVLLKPEDGAGKPLERTFRDTPAAEWTFPAVPAGVYEAVLRREVEGDELSMVDVTRRARVEVRGGEAVRVELVPLP